MFAGILFADGTFFALLTFAAAVIHELGHIAAALLSRVPVKAIDVYPLGAVITLTPPCPYSADVLIKLAGGLANLIAAAVCAAIYVLTAPSCAAGAVFFIMNNLALAVFNLLPIRTLDGGEALYSALCMKLEPDTADRRMRTLSFCALVPLWIVSGYILFYTGWNFTLLLICGWLFFSAVLECRHAAKREDKRAIRF